MSKFKYFVARYPEDTRYRCRRVGYFSSQGIVTIWEGNNLQEGQMVAKEANAKLRPPPKPKEPIISREDRERIRRKEREGRMAEKLRIKQEADKTKLEKWVKMAHETGVTE